MPNRILRAGILESDRVDALSPGAEIFYRRLMSVVDDYGRFEADARTLRSRCWPQSPESVGKQELEQWIGECATVIEGEDEALIQIYRVGRKTYLQITNFNQPIRSKSKCPAPEEGQLAVVTRQVTASLPQPKVDEVLCSQEFSEAGEGSPRGSETESATQMPSDCEHLQNDTRTNTEYGKTNYALAYGIRTTHSETHSETRLRSETADENCAREVKPNGRSPANGNGNGTGHAFGRGKPPPRKRPSYAVALANGEVENLEDYNRRYPKS